MGIDSRADSVKNDIPDVLEKERVQLRRGEVEYI